jgi:SRSO17 transposase
MANKEEIRERIRIQQAWLDGEVIQHKYPNDVGWRDIASPSSNADMSAYRIKPKHREVWVTYNKDGVLSAVSSDCFAPHASCSIVLFREVLEDE